MTFIFSNVWFLLYVFHKQPCNPLTKCQLWSFIMKHAAVQCGYSTDDIHKMLRKAYYDDLCQFIN